MRFHFSLPLAVAVLAVEIIFGRTVRGVGHRVRFRAGDATVLRMLLAAASLTDYRDRVASFTLARVAAADIADTMLADAHLVL
jgi:hypothetical protein